MGVDLVESMLAVFREVAPEMNLCMQTELRTRMLSTLSRTAVRG